MLSCGFLINKSNGALACTAQGKIVIVVRQEDATHTIL